MDLVDGALTQPFKLIVTEYRPAFAAVTLVIVIVALLEVKFGPVHAYVAPTARVEAVSWIVSPAQSTESTALTVTVGIAFTVTVLLVEELTQPLEVTVTEYAPELLTVALLILMIEPVPVKPLGPLHVKIALGALDAAASWIVSPAHRMESTTVTLGAEGAEKLPTE